MGRRFLNQLTTVYVDTSVFGGAYDEEFRVSSMAFFDEVRSGRFNACVSEIVLEELRGAPQMVRDLYSELSPNLATVDVSRKAVLLMRAYLAAGIVGEKWRADALHVAVATVNDCRAIVSWNFKHIVHFDKISLYNEVNIAEGFGTLAIHSPNEMVSYED